MLIGRQKEIELLNKIYEDNTSHFVSVYGRRRIGKTYLVNETYKDNMLFHHSGVAGGSLKEQLFAFSASLKNSSYLPKTKIDNWFVAFEELKDLIRDSSLTRKGYLY